MAQYSCLVDIPQSLVMQVMASIGYTTCVSRYSVDSLVAQMQKAQVVGGERNTHLPDLMTENADGSI